MSQHSERSLTRARSISRGVGSIVGIILGVVYGSYVLPDLQTIIPSIEEKQVIFICFALIGAIVVALIAPAITVDAFCWAEDFVDTGNIGEVLGAIGGVIIAGIVTALAIVILGGIPDGGGLIISLVLGYTCGYLGIRLGRMRQSEIVDFMRGSRVRIQKSNSKLLIPSQNILIDTSVLIDGRVNRVVKTGIISNPLIILSCVLHELQVIADSTNEIRRVRGKVGLEVAEALLKANDVICTVMECPEDKNDMDVDSHLLVVAQSMSGALMTTDANLEKLARVQGIRTINMNALAQSLRSEIRSGDILHVTVSKVGKENKQGIGFLDDGTMIVIEGARKYVGESVDIVISNVLQTGTGKMAFASMRNTESGNEVSAERNKTQGASP